MLFEPTADRLALLALLVALGACSSQARNPIRTDACFAGYVDEPVLEEELRSTKDCCSTLAALPTVPYPQPTPLAPSAPQTGTPAATPGATPPAAPTFVSLTPISPVFSFPQGKSRFVALDLETLGRTASSITVVPLRSGFTSQARSCIEKGGFSGETYRYLRPLMTFLDAAKRPIAPGLTGDSVQSGIFAALRFNVPVGSRYAVLHTAPSMFGSRFQLPGGSRIDLMPVPLTSALLPTRVDGSINGLVSSTGVVELRID